MYKLNDTVKIKNTNIIGKIEKIKINKDKTFYTVVYGTGKIVVDEENLEKTTLKTKKHFEVNFSLSSKDEASDEIMLRHMHKEEALEALDKFIDSAICARKLKVRIIHGRHGHILKDAVREYLSYHPNVDRFEYGAYDEGSIGVTIAYLKY